MVSKVLFPGILNLCGMHICQFGTLFPWGCIGKLQDQPILHFTLFRWVSGGCHDAFLSVTKISQFSLPAKLLMKGFCFDFFCTMHYMSGLGKYSII